MAQKADLRGKINLDSSGFKRGIAQAKGSVGTFVNTLKGSLLPALGAAGAAGAMISFGRRAIESASQIKELSQVSGLSVVEFQKFAEAARTVNIEQEKLADIFKDTSDKMGDFMETGGGAMADFFEKIAPLVGATKEEFMGLSGADSLQRYFNYLEKANIPHQEMVFYMEAIASDATMLIPLLENGGEAFRELGNGAEEAGRVMSEETIEALDQANEEIDRFMQNVTIFTGQFLAKLRPAKDELRELAIEQLKAEDAFSKGFFGKRIAIFTGSDGDLIRERVALLKEESDAAELVKMQNEQNALTLQKIASVNEGRAKSAAKEAEMAAKLQKIKDNATSKPDFAAIEKAENARKEKIQEIRKTIKPDLNKQTKDGKDAGKAYSTGFFAEFEEQSQLRSSDILKSEISDISQQREERRRVGDFSGDRQLRDQESALRSEMREARGQERTDRLLASLGREPGGNNRQNNESNNRRSRANEYYQKSIDLKTSIKDLLDPVSKYYSDGSLFSLQKDAYKSQLDLYKLTETQSENIKTVVEKLNRLDQALR